MRDLSETEGRLLQAMLRELLLERLSDVLADEQRVARERALVALAPLAHGGDVSQERGSVPQR